MSKKTKRERLASATMDEGARKWLYKTAHKAKWRVAPWIDLDDLYQDGCMCYALVIQRYPQAVDRPHVMRLFQTIYNNHIHALSKAATKSAAEFCDDDVVAHSDQPCPDAELSRLLIEAPDIVQRTLLALMEADREHERYADGSRETTNEKFCKMIGEDPAKVDAHTMVREYLHGLQAA